MVSGIVLSDGKCAYVLAKEPATAQLLACSGLTLHVFKGSDRCAPDCAGCRYDAPDGSWCTGDPRRLLRVPGARLVLPPKPPPSPATDPSRATDASIEVSMPPGRTLRPYQRAAVAYSIGRRNVLLAEEMGLGKTCETIAIINYDRDARRILVIAPASLRINWQREIQMWDVARGDVLICDHADDVDLSSPERLWLITNADKLVAARARRGVDMKERAGGLWDRLMKAEWDYLIIDEAHKFVNIKAARTPRLLGRKKTRQAPAEPGLVQRAKRVLALTGTPIPNRVRNLWPLCSALAPEVFNKEGTFLFAYCAPKQEQIRVRGGGGETKLVWNFEGASKLAQLQQLLRDTIMIRRLKKDVLTELPAKTRQVLPLPYDEFRAQADAERDGWLKLAPALSEARADALIAEALEDAYEYDQALERLSSEIKGLPIGEIAAQREALALAKASFVGEQVWRALDDPEIKVVVMAHHHSVIERLADQFKLLRNMQGIDDRNDVVVYGPTSLLLRQARVDYFQTDPRVRIFIAGMHAAGVGLTLTAATLMIFAEPDWQPDVLAQCEDRIHRIGQNRPVLIQYPVVDASVEALVLAAALRKQRIIEQALDGAPTPKDRRTFARASDADRRFALEVLRVWQDGPNRRYLSERVRVITDGMLARLGRRPLTDGETWLCKKIARENWSLLPPEMRPFATS